MPLGGRGSYDRFGQRYDITQILDESGRNLDPAKYAQYSALYLPGPYVMVYLLAFALATCLIVHTALYHGRSIMNGIKRIKIEEDDIHAKLMRVYPEVPDAWYATICVVFFILAVVAVEVWPTRMPVWALALAVLIPCIYVLPCGFVYAVTAQGVSINLVAEIMPGAMLPGQPLPNMVRTRYVRQSSLFAHCSFGLAFQSICSTDYRSSHDFHTRSQAWSLHQGPTESIVPRSVDRYHPWQFRANRSQRMALCKRQGYVLGDAERFPCVPSKPSILQRFCHLV